MGFIREDELISRKLKTCENCEWCIPIIEKNKKFEIDAIIPKKVTKELAEMLVKNDLNGVCISTESEELGIYKSFNYEIFERRPSVVLAFDGNSPVSNLVQEAKNGKGKARIYINDSVDALKEKA